MSLRNTLLVALTLATALQPVAVAQEGPQPHHYSSTLISAQHVAVVGLTLFATSFGDEGLREEFQEFRTAGTNSMARIGNMFGEPFYVFPALGVGYLAGRLTGSESLSRFSLRAGTAAILASGITTVVKYSLGRTRPGNEGDSDHFRPFSGSSSFPSGHTTLAFAVATAIADETRDAWSDVALYGAAALTGFARMNDDRHWASDVMAGALIGHLSARWLSRRQGWLRAGPGSLGIGIRF
ncbi:MAG TPA: phosphatase PAP2 family protein [Gemmatimonadales bacterium]|nr:phosphatase PAP2 family protein [Gemmatimonadales bacterium]